MDRQQLDGGDAEVVEVVGDHVVPQPGVGPAQLLGDPVVQRGEALDVQLVDRGVAPAGADLAVVAPVEVVVHDDAAPDVRRGVALVAVVEVVPARLVADGVVLDVAEHGRVGDELAAHRARVGIQQQLVRVEPQPLVGAPRAVDPVAVALSDGYAGHGAVPDPEAVLGQRVPGLDAPRRRRPRRRGTPTRRWPRGSARRSWSTPRSTWRRGASCVPATPRRARRRSTTLLESPTEYVVSARDVSGLRHQPPGVARVGDRHGRGHANRSFRPVSDSQPR